MLRLCSIAVAIAVALSLGASNAAADTIEHQIIDGTQSGVSYSWLTSGSSIHGSLPSAGAKWRLSGTSDFTYDTSGEITTGSGTIDVFEKISGTYTKVGTVEITDAGFEDADWDSGLLGSFTITLTATDLTSDFASRIDDYGSTAIVGFKDKRYGTATSEFNTYDESKILGWGNELITQEFDGTYSGTSGQAGNWGFDWYSVSAVPEPGSLVLLGMGVLGLAIARRRRDASAGV